MSTYNTKRKFQGVWIPAAIWLDKNLSITEKVMLVEINSLESSDRGCFASNEHFAEFFNLSKSRVSEIISELTTKGLVRVDLIREGKQIIGRQIWMTENGQLTLGGNIPSSENAHTPLRKTRIPPFGKGDDPSSEKVATLFGKGDDPSSEKAKESNTDFNNTKSNTGSDIQEPLSTPTSTKVKTIPSPKKTGEEEALQSACRATWKSYCDSYFNRYGVEPIRNATVNTHIKAFCKKIPHQEAPHVAAFFVSHNDKFYIQKTHHSSLMSKDAEGLRTQWATGRTMTASKATQIDRTANNLDTVNQAIEMMRARKQNATV